jgi:cob(I)alamin adenosyltransferase
MEKKYVANKAVIIDQKGRMLLLRDAGSGDHVHAKGKLGFPGGRMDHNETPHEGLLRELKEETGLSESELEIGTPFFVGRWGVKGNMVKDPIIGIFYLVKAKKELDIKLSEEHTEIFWFNPQLPLTDEMRDGAHAIIEAYRNHMGITVGSDDRIKGREGYGLIQVFTGNGKGKTTAALGEVVRAAGAKKKVGIVYFDKGGDTHYSERKILDKLETVSYLATGRDRIDPDTGRFDFSITDEDKQEAQRGLDKAQAMFDEGCDLVVLDEVNSTTDLGMLDVTDVLKLIDNKPETTEVIMTGRHAPKEFLERAHLITQMRLNRHYFYSGVPAREGLDY